MGGFGDWDVGAVCVSGLDADVGFRDQASLGLTGFVKVLQAWGLAIGVRVEGFRGHFEECWLCHGF